MYYIYNQFFLNKEKLKCPTVANRLDNSHKNHYDLLN